MKLTCVLAGMLLVSPSALAVASETEVTDMDEAGSSETLRSLVAAKLGVGGATNCEYKCANLFNINNIWDESGQSAVLNGLADGSPSSVLNEYIACVKGCYSCNGGVNANCQKECKNTNWFNTNWAYNPYSGVIKFIDCGAAANGLIAQQKACIDRAGVPYTGGRAHLQKQYTAKTQQCYDNPTYGIYAINAACNAKCRNEATCSAYDLSGKTCAGTDLKEQYTAAMCGASIRKNIIEPDKACIFGCVQNLCQKGPQCMGNEPWSSKTNFKKCQLITPQSNGEKYTIVPQIFNDFSQGDAADCCTRTRTCCSYKEGWTLADGGEQRKGVCHVAAEDCKTVSGFDRKGLINPTGPYPGNSCNDLWKDGGLCPNLGLSCSECRIN